MKIVYAQVKPGSKKGPLVRRNEDGSLVLFVQERPVDGKATAAACALLADHLGVPNSAVTLAKGATSRFKAFEVRGY